MPTRPFATAALACALLAACGSDEPPPAASIAELERQGRLPALERGADLAGPDLDGNGVRDDIDAWIARQPDPARHGALRQLARAFRAALLAAGRDPAALQDAAAQNTRAIACIMSQGGEGAQAVHDMRKMTANTKARVAAYLDYAGALHGAVLSLPAEGACDD